MKVKKLDNIYKKLKIIGNDNENSLILNLLKVPKKDSKINTPTTNGTTTKNVSHQVDLLFLPYDENNKYLLVCVDVATHTVDAFPLKTKNAETVKDALEKIYKGKYLKRPKYLEVDDGSEFKGAFKSFYEKNDVKMVVKLPGRSRQQSVVEYMNGLISSIIQRYQIAQELHSGVPFVKWVHLIKPIIQELNKNFQKETKETIEEAGRCEGPSCALLNIGEPVRVILDKPQDFTTKKRLNGSFRIGDIRWNPEIKTIKNVQLEPNQPAMYEIKGLPKVRYTKNQLQKVNSNEVLPPVHKDTLFKFEKIIDKRKFKNKIQYLIKWKNYPSSENSWESRTELIKDGLEDEIKKFDKK